MLKVYKILLYSTISISCLDASNKQIDWNNTNLLDLYGNRTVGQIIQTTVNVPVFNTNETINNELINKKRFRTDNETEKKYKITKEHVVPEYVKRFYLNRTLFNEINNFFDKYNVVDNLNKELSRDTQSNVKKFVYMSRPNCYGKWLPVKTKELLKTDCCIEIKAVMDNNQYEHTNINIGELLNNLCIDIENNNIKSIIECKNNNHYQTLSQLIIGNNTISSILNQFFQVYTNYSNSCITVLKNMHYSPNSAHYHRGIAYDTLYTIMDNNNLIIKLNNKPIKLNKMMSLNISDNGREYYVTSRHHSVIQNKYIQKEIFNQLWDNNFIDSTNKVKAELIKNSKTYANTVSLLLVHYLEKLTKNKNIIDCDAELQSLCKTVGNYINNFYTDNTELALFDNYILSSNATKNHKLNGNGTITRFSNKFKPRISHLIQQDNTINDLINTNQSDVNKNNDLILPVLIERSPEQEINNNSKNIYNKKNNEKLTEDNKLIKPIIINDNENSDNKDHIHNNTNRHYKKNNTMQFLVPQYYYGNPLVYPTLFNTNNATGLLDIPMFPNNLLFFPYNPLSSFSLLHKPYTQYNYNRIPYFNNYNTNNSIFKRSKQITNQSNTFKNDNDLNNDLTIELHNVSNNKQIDHDIKKSSPLNTIQNNNSKKDALLDIGVNNAIINDNNSQNKKTKLFMNLQSNKVINQNNHNNNTIKNQANNTIKKPALFKLPNIIDTENNKKQKTSLFEAIATNNEINKTEIPQTNIDESINNSIVSNKDLPTNTNLSNKIKYNNKLNIKNISNDSVDKNKSHLFKVITTGNAVSNDEKTNNIKNTTVNESNLFKEIVGKNK